MCVCARGTVGVGMAGDKATSAISFRPAREKLNRISDVIENRLFAVRFPAPLPFPPDLLFFSLVFI